MNTIERLFGVNADEIKEDVIITPFLNLEYFARGTKPKKTKGFLFEVLTQKQFSVVKTGVGASFVGDAVMYLGETPCKRIYFIGSCASLSPHEVGDTIVAEKALACESFTEVLHTHTDDCSFVVPKHNLADEFFEFCRSKSGEDNQEQQIKTASLASLGSLSLQHTVLGSLQQRGVGGVDMEASAFFSAANSLFLSCLGLFYVTDTIDQKLFFRNLSVEERKTIKTARQRTIELLCDFIKQRSD